MMKKQETLNLDTNIIREIVEKAFTKAAVDKDLGAINRLTEKDFKKISEAAFTKAAVDKDLA
jgi:isocitrate/isopropylmalate dehydrogenase